MTRHYIITYASHSSIVYTQRPISEVRRVFGDYEGYAIYRGRGIEDAVEEKLVEEHATRK
jgi:hypothetical protein